MRGRKNWEDDETAYPSGQAYRIDGHRGIAWRAFGWEIETLFDTDTGDTEEQRTGKVVCVMIGDDRRFAFDPEDIHAIEREEYCGVCGQMGCCHDGLDRSEVA